MSAKPLKTSSFAAIAVALLAGAANCAAGDAVAASFERMLAHEPVRSGPTQSAGAQADPLIDAMVLPLRDGIRRTPRQQVADPVAESFVRMLSHRPGNHRPPVPAGFGTDPLIEALVEPLRQQLSDHGMAARHAHASSARTVP